MMNPWLTLGTGAFVISFAISLLMTRDFGGAIVTGSLALATAFVTAAAVNWYHNRVADSRIATLKQQVRLLQYRRAEEQQAVLEMSAEKERVAMSLYSLQEQLRQQQLSGSLPSARPTLSWDLSTQPIGTLPEFAGGYSNAEHRDAKGDSDDLNQFIAEATATRQKINASLNHLQAELSQINAQINEQQTVREQITQDVTQLNNQKQDLIVTTTALKAEIEELERCRTELDNYITYVEAKKQELESGSNPLQKALKQLQEQVNALQAELIPLEQDVTSKRKEKERLEQSIADLQPQQAAFQAIQEKVQTLEGNKHQLERELADLKQQQQQLTNVQENLQKLEKQINDRRQEKESLERQITQLQAQKTSLRNQPPANKDQPQKEAREATPKQHSTKKTSHKHIAEEQLRLSASPAQADKWASNHHNDNVKSASKPDLDEVPKATTFTEQINGHQAAIKLEQDLPDAWTDFMLQLPEYELRVLKAIAQESNATRIVNRIAADNFTTADELIDSINRLAKNMVGEPIIKTRSNFSPPTILRNHIKTIKKLIETYEYLTD